jgi:hypothetical protein
MFGRKIANKNPTLPQSNDQLDNMNIFDIGNMKLDDPKFKGNEKKFEYIDQIFQENFDIKKKNHSNKLNEKFEDYNQNFKKNVKQENQEHTPPNDTENDKINPDNVP